MINISGREEVRVDPVIKSLGRKALGLVDIHILHAGFLLQSVQGAQPHQF